MLLKLFSRFTEPTYALLRIFAGLLFFCHGAQKLFGWFGGEVRTTPLMITAGVVEFFGGLAIAIGLLTPLAAFLSAGQMAVAYLMSHATRALMPIENRGELALLYMFVFLFLMARGSGARSVDSVLFKEAEVKEEGG